jgi:hypothetical protein
MAPIKKDRTDDEEAGPENTWRPPVVKKIAIGAETKSAAGENISGPAEPQPPATPASKLGFSFEMSFPMSTRYKK